MDDVGDVLRRARSFTGFIDEDLALLAAVARSVEFQAGDIVYRRNEPADSLAVVRTGRLEVFDIDGEGRLGAELSAGAVVGELGVLAGGRRSATVRAVRDSELIVIEGGPFLEVLARRPVAALTLARSLAERLQHSRDVAPAAPSTAVIAVVPAIADGSWTRFTEGLVQALSSWGPVLSIGADDGAGVRGVVSGGRARLSAAERAGELAVLVVTDPLLDPEWTSFCLRSADRAMLLLDDRGLPAWTTQTQGLRGCDLVLSGRITPSAVDVALASLPHRTHHFIGTPSMAPDIARVARRVSGRAVGLVLSGGGARGFAHVGAVAALHAAGIHPDRIGGTSMGALVGGLVAMGWSAARVRTALELELVERNPFNDFTVPRRSVIRGAKAAAMLQRLLGSTGIEHLPIPYFAVSADLATGGRVIHDRGPTWEAVAASMAVPGLAPPVTIGDRVLVDGGVLDNLPVEVMGADGEGPVVAVDVMRHFQGPHARGKGLRGDRSRPPILEILVRAGLLGSRERAAASRSVADLVVTPEVADIGLLEFSRAESAVVAGALAMSQALETASGRAVLGGAGIR